MKANNTDDLNLATSWVGGLTPSDTLVALWNNTVTSANTTLLGADATWLGIQITNPGGAVTINGTNTLTLGGAAVDIDMSNATQDLTLNHPLAMSNANTWSVNAGRTLSLNGVVSGSSAVTTTGAGTVVLGGANTYTGSTNVNGGIMNITGSITGLPASSKINIAPTTGNAIVNYSGGNSTLFAVTGATVAGTASAFNMTAGNITISPSTTTGTQSVVGAGNTPAAGAGAYGYYNITGGVFKDINRFTLTGQATASATNGTGSGVQTGVVFVGGTGMIDLTNSEWTLNYSLGQITVADSGKIDRTGSTQPFGLIMNHAANVTGGGYGVLNLAGTNAEVITGAQSIRFGNNTTANQGSGQSAFVNVAAGTLSVGANVSTSLPASPTVPNSAYFNFAGGTVKATGNLSGWIPATTAPASIVFNSTIFGPIDNAGTSSDFAGGVTFDTNGFSMAVANPLQVASGAGVTQADLTVNGGSGYVGAPAVIFSSTDVIAGGSPAAGYAVISGGAVTQIVITSPGTYTPGTIPTVTLIGGGGTGASVSVAALNTANTSGGLTKNGLGALTLTGANTYTGPTAVNAGALTVSGTGALSGTTSLTVASGATFNYLPATIGSDLVLGTGSTLTLNNGSTLGLSWDTATSSRITASGAATVGTGTGVTLVMSGSPTSGTPYTILSAASGLDVGNYQVFNLTDYTVAISKTATSVTVTPTAATPLTTAYWKGGFSGYPGVWSATNGLGGVSGLSNWTTDAAGTVNTALSPGAGTDVFFSATGAGDQNAMTLGASMSINSLTVNDASAPNTNPVTLLSTSGNTLTLAAGSGTGITVNAGAGAVTLAPAIVLGAAQTWTNNSTSTLTASGAISGSVAFTKAGSGTVNLTGSTALSAVTVDAGTLYLGAQTGESIITTLGATTPVTLNGTGNLTIRRTDVALLDVVGAIGGTGSLTFIGDNANTVGSGQINLNDTHTFSGGTTIISARANATNTASFGTGPVTVGASAGVFFITTNLSFTNNFNIGGQGWQENSGLLGALRLNSTTLNGNITLTSNARIAGNGSSFLNGKISGAFALDFFEDTAVGTITLAGDNDYTGPTIINSMGNIASFPNLIVAHNNALGTTAGGTTVFGTGTTANGGLLTLADGITVTGETLTLDTTENAYRVSLITAGTATWDGNVVLSGTGGSPGLIANGASANLTVGSSADDTITGTTALLIRGTGVGTIHSKISHGTAGIVKTDAGTWTITSNNNDFTGNVTIPSGVLSVGSIANAGINSALGAGTTISLGQDSATEGRLRFTGVTGGASNRALILSNGAAGAGAIENTVAGQTLTLTGSFTVATPGSASTLSLLGEGNGVLTGSILNSPAMSLVKGGAGTWTLSGANTYTGETTIDQGTLAFSTNDHSLTGALTFGSAAGSTNVGALDLSAASASFGGLMTVRTNNATANTIALGTGRTLTNTGNIYVGSGAAGAVAKLAVSGAGAWSINNPSGRLVVANTDPSNTGASAQLDLSGLASFSADLANVYVGRPTNSAGGPANGSPVTDTLTLAASNTIKASGVLAVGATNQSFSGPQNSFLRLGTLNTVNADTIVIGAARTSGVLAFASGLTNPTVTLRGTAGGSTAANIYLGDAQNQQGVASASNGSSSSRGTIDFTGGAVDAVINELVAGNGAIGTSGNRGAGFGTFIIDGASSNVSINTMIVARTRNDTGTNASGASPAACIFTLKNGTLVVNTEASLAKDLDASNTSGGTQNLSAQFNVQGGTATIGSTLTPVPLIVGSQVAGGNAGTMVASVSITGGTLNVFGDLTEGTQGNGTITSTLALNGGTLDMKGNRIGLSGALIDTLDIQSGTLANVAEINNGGAWTKSGTGTLVMQGSNTYTGNTVIADGTLELPDNASIKFVLGATSGVSNSISGAGVATLNGDFVIDTTAADALSSGTWTLENVSTLTGEYGSTFSVVGFVNAGGNKWTKDIGGGKTYTFDETTGVLTLASAGGYASWAAINAIGSTPDQDKDGDGVPNAVEYLLGGDVNTNDLSKLPQSTVSGTNLVFTFQRDVDTTGAATVTIEVGTTLAAWPDVYSVGANTAGSTNPEVVVTEDSSPGFDTITLTVPMGTATKKFARLKVEVAE